ncbi:MAG: T9SS type A sorting domain-containing protein [Bacteroidia bacterium]|nr:T9SS type A sorting domain-containing protein [Bacteroidia bacterium]
MKLLLNFIFILICASLMAQSRNFPQTKINELTSKQQLPQNTIITGKLQKPEINHGIFKALEFFDYINKNQKKITDKRLYKKSSDTLIIGEVPGDTVVIKGNWNHTGPIWIFNDGVLIFKNAVVNDTGDIYVLGKGKLIADSCVFNFPQKYFYERGLLALQNAKIEINNCSFNYSGMSHTLYIANNANITMRNVKNRDFTTCGMFGSPTLLIDGCNLTGEYILNDSCSATFLNADTIILWHQIPNKAEIDFSFPNGDYVTNYSINKSTSGVKGINYNVYSDKCKTVMWAIMPVNGSKVKISNSKLRLIGNWFMRGDSATLKGIFNNSHYNDYTIPLTDRQLRLINCDVQTWSIYVFDSSKILIDSCTLGEVGSQNKSEIFAVNYTCDGSGGYFWATDTSIMIANNVNVYTTIRSERNALVILANSWLPFMPPSAIHKSILVCSQNRFNFSPIAYDQSVVWNLKIDKPDTTMNQIIVPVYGSAWIKQGPGGNPMEFDSYSLSYRNINETKWTYINKKRTTMIEDEMLEEWNTAGLVPGYYLLKLTVKDNYGDTVDAYKIVVVQSSLSANKNITNQNITISPNPFSEFLTINFENQAISNNIYLLNSYGKVIRNYNGIKTDKFKISRENISNGIYFIRIENENSIVKTYKVLIY